jgi:uncharacterized protein YjiS (DUF1127 family)
MEPIMNPYTLYPLTNRRAVVPGAGPSGELSIAVFKLVDGAFGAATALARAIARWRKRREAIAEISALSDRLLRDIGVARRDIRRAVDGRLDAPVAVHAARPRPPSSTVAIRPAGRRAAPANDNRAGIAA